MDGRTHRRWARRAAWGGAVLLLSFYGCTGDIGDPPGTPEVPQGAESAVISGARRLTRTEYDDTLRDLLQDDSRSGFALLPEDVNDPFDNDYHTQKVSPSLVEAAETLANQAAERAVADPTVIDAIVPCSPSGPSDDECLREFVSAFGRRALRRPLSDDEIEEYVYQFQPFAEEGDDFLIAVRLTIAALLQDLEFLYRIERGEEVPGKPGVFKLDDYEMATRLSYFLIGSTPPDWLLDEAGQEKLTTPDGVRAAAEKLMDDPRARVRVERFHALWLGFHQLPHDAELVEALRAETRALIERVVFDEPSDYFELFRSEQTYLTDYLAGHYGYEAPGGADWVTYSDERRGILSHGSVLSSFGKFSDTSPTQRGIFIRTRLLCQEIPPPPPDVDSDNPPSGEAGDCKSDVYAQHDQGGCYDCHKMMDPIGFGLERYDNQGRFRTHDDGKPECTITGDGSIDGVGDFNGPAELAELVIESGALESCVVTQVYRLAMGRRETVADREILNGLTDRFAETEYAFDELLVELVSAESFGFRVQEEVE
jgi:hypothetical protein